MMAAPVQCMGSLEVALATFDVAIVRLTSWLLVQLGLQSSSSLADHHRVDGESEETIMPCRSEPG